MPQKTHILFLFFIFAINIGVTAQEFKVIDKKGTIQSIANGISDWVLSSAYEDKQFVTRDNKIYRANGAIPANTTFAIGNTGATWTEVSGYLGSTVHVNTFTTLADANATQKVHIEQGGSLTIDGNVLSDGFSVLVINHSGFDSNISFSNFTGVFELNQRQEVITNNLSFTIEYLESAFLTITENAGNIYLNINRFGGGDNANTNVNNELIFNGEDDATATTDDNFYYVSLVVDNNWRVIRYHKNDVNVEDVADVNNNPTQLTQPTTVAVCIGLTYN